MTGAIPRPAYVAVPLALAGGGAGQVLRLAEGAPGAAGPAVWAILAAATVAFAVGLRRLARVEPRSVAARRLHGLVVPAFLGVWALIVWQAVTVGAGVPPVLLPSPGAIGARFAASLPLLAEDALQTFVRGALTGYAIGNLAGFAAALAADRSPFLRRGLVPVAGLASALPLVGIAPIAVMWFGFDWPSKAAVVTVMTFFPMFVGATAGLAAAGRLELDLLRSYGAGYVATLTKLRLPAALPFVFGALKLNSTLALIGAIVAEFFGTPTVGMGFRISIEVGRLNLDTVWAEIALAALLGTAFYGAVAGAERLLTSWHPSFRAGAAAR